MRKPKPVEDRILQFTKDPSNINDCWPWQSSLNVDGYGMLQCSNKLLRAHRVSWEVANGSHIPDGMQILHTCDNPRCVNPDHLWLGTNQDNKDDAIEKGRASPPPPCKTRGEDHPRALLTWDIVHTIRRLWSKGKATKQKLAETYGVTESCIQAITSNRNWREQND